MRRMTIVTLLAFGCLVCLGAVSPGRLHFKTTGFSIEPLETPPGRTPHQALMMFLPASDGFAPNVNVQVQPYAGTIGEYAALSRKQFVAAKFKPIKETRLGKAAVLLEYSGKLQGRSLHWYAKAVSTGTTVYLATATATETQWRTAAGRLKACVDSLGAARPERGADGGTGPRTP